MPMAKTIVFCADGTWNGPGEANVTDVGSAPTNVFKLFTSLAGTDAIEQICLSDEQERRAVDAVGTVVQIAKYLHGVGDSNNFLARILGGTLGAGIISRIVRGFTFISRNYVAGDRIFLIGFSRGAYTARALGGLIAAKGLLDPAGLDPTDKVPAYRAGAAVWYDWRRSVLGANPSLLGRLQEMVVDLPAFVSLPPPGRMIVDVPIEAIAVWDTVGSLGIPVYANQDSTLDAFRFADTVLSSKVRHGIHAVAVDEQRANFTPTLWDSDPRIVQCLWPGSHADVGGGYPLANGESKLSDASRAWFMEKLAALGVLFAPSPVFPLDPDPTAVAHLSYTHSPFDILPYGLRVFPAGIALSAALIARRAAGPVVADPGLAAAIYNPTNVTGAIACV
jgi:uncharacterized protein (DUF2235 family)